MPIHQTEIAMDNQPLFDSVSRALPLLIALLCLSLACAAPALGQYDESGPAPTATPEQKIDNALSAAPEQIARAAAVWDWPAEGDTESPVLRDGENGWTCFPDFPGTPGNDPMCHDEEFMKWHLAVMQQSEPKLERVGLSYMLAGGGFEDDSGAPIVGPHIMLALPDRADAEGIQHVEYVGVTPEADTPHIYHGGTPYEIVIVPVAAAGEWIQVMEK